MGCLCTSASSSLLSLHRWWHWRGRPPNAGCRAVRGGRRRPWSRAPGHCG